MRMVLLGSVALAGMLAALLPGAASAAPNGSASCTAEIRQPWGGLDAWAQAGLGGDWGQEVQLYKRYFKPIGQTFCDPFPPAGG